MPWNFRTEITETRPIKSFTEVDLCDHHVAPLLALRKDAAFAVVDRREHPVAAYFGIRAADKEDVVFASACRGQHRIATGDGKRNQFSAVFG